MAPSVINTLRTRFFADIYMRGAAHDKISPELKAVIDTGLVRWRRGKQYLLELGFEGERMGKRTDFISELPLLLRS
jgi:hypothetical protein